MDLFIQLLIGILPAVISGFAAYFTAKNKAEIELKKVERESENRIKEFREKVEAELDSYERKLNADSTNDLTNQVFKGELDFEKLGNALEQMGNLDEQMQKVNRRNKRK